MNVFHDGDIDALAGRVPSEKLSSMSVCEFDNEDYDSASIFRSAIRLCQQHADADVCEVRSHDKTYYFLVTEENTIDRLKKELMALEADGNVSKVDNTYIWNP